jgi:hypothetical protein
LPGSGTYYTTAYKQRIVKALCLGILVSFAFFWTDILNHTVFIGFSIIHGYILGMTISYFLYGITCPKQIKHIFNGTAAFSFGIAAALFGRIELLVFMICAVLVVFIVSLDKRHKNGRCNGDNAVFSEGDFDPSWFDFVTEDLARYPVLFPRDMGNYRKDRLPGRMVEVGMGIQGKYEGIPIARIQSDSGCYLCPLEQLIPNPSMKSRGSAFIASRHGNKPCEVTVWWHEYGGHIAITNYSNKR